jgi:hypothetical protein
MKKFAFAALLALGLVALMAPPVAFAADEEKPFTIHGEVRARAEYQNNASDFTDQDANTPFDSDDGAFFFPYRFRIAAEGNFTKNVGAWIEFQNTGVFGGDEDGPRKTGAGYPFGGSGDSAVEVYQAYVTLGELWSKSFSLRIGRQEIVMGNEFILGDEDFYGGISHDGIVATWNLKNVNITAWYTRPFEDSVSNVQADLPPDINANFFGIDGSADNHEFLGGYASWTVHKDQDIDVYLTNSNDRGTGGRYQTLGARYGRDGMDKSGFVWNIELATQFGTVMSAFITGVPDDVDASGMGAEGWFGYNWKGGKNVHRVYGRLEYATGNEDNPDPVTGFDNEDEGFLGLFGEIHNRAGRGDWFRVQADDSTYGAGTTTLGGNFIDEGLMALSVGYTGLYNERHEFGVALWDYTAEQEIDLDPAAATTDLQDDLGTAWDIWYGFNYTKNVAFEASYSTLSPGDALTLIPGTPPTSGPDDSVERFYGQLRLRF